MARTLVTYCKQQLAASEKAEAKLQEEDITVVAASIPATKPRRP